MLISHKGVTDILLHDRKRKQRVPFGWHTLFRLSKKQWVLANYTSRETVGNPSLGFPTAKPSIGRFGLPS